MKAITTNNNLALSRSLNIILLLLICSQCRGFAGRSAVNLKDKNEISFQSNSLKLQGKGAESNSGLRARANRSEVNFNGASNNQENNKLRSLNDKWHNQFSSSTLQTVEDANVDNWFKAGDDVNGTEVGSQFGDSVAISKNGNFMAVGARFHDGGNGEIPNSGTVRVFRRQQNENAVSWVQRGGDIDGEQAGDFFGKSISMSNDGMMVAVGAPRSNNNIGKVRVYKFNLLENAWNKMGDDIGGLMKAESQTTASKSNIGCFISLSGNGSALAISGDRDVNDKLLVRVFGLDNNDMKWKEQASKAKIDVDYAKCASISLSADGNILAVGESFGESDIPSSISPGRVRVFAFVQDVWRPVGDPQGIDGKGANEKLGMSISLSDDGNTLAASGTDVVRIYRLDVNQWKPYPIDDGDIIATELNSGGIKGTFGKSVSLSGDGQKVVIGTPENSENGDVGSGLVQVFQLNGGEWSPLGTPIHGRALDYDGRLGFSVAISQDGSSLIAGAPHRHNHDAGGNGYVSIYDLYLKPSSSPSLSPTSRSSSPSFLTAFPSKSISARPSTRHSDRPSTVPSSWSNRPSVSPTISPKPSGIASPSPSTPPSLSFSPTTSSSPSAKPSAQELKGVYNESTEKSALKTSIGTLTGVVAVAIFAAMFFKGRKVLLTHKMKASRGDLLSVNDGSEEESCDHLDTIEPTLPLNSKSKIGSWSHHATSDSPISPTSTNSSSRSNAVVAIERVLPIQPIGNYDAYISHEWGERWINHKRVSVLNKALAERGLGVWFHDENKQLLHDRTTELIDNSSFVIVFITQDYIRKVAGRGPNGSNEKCKVEFEYALQQKGIDRIIPVVMEHQCRNSSSWQGPVGLLASHLRYSFMNDGDLDRCVSKIVQEIKKRNNQSTFSQDLNMTDPSSWVNSNGDEINTGSKSLGGSNGRDESFSSRDIDSRVNESAGGWSTDSMVDDQIPWPSNT